METDPLDALFRQAKAGDATVLPELKRTLDERPEIWQTVADLGRQAEQAQVDLVAGTDLALKESLRRKLHHVRQQLGFGVVSPLESLLIDRVAISWLRLVYADMMQVQSVDVDLPQAKFLADRRDRAERSHLHAIRQLAVVRKLLVPA